MQAREKREITEKTRRPAESSARLLRAKIRELPHRESNLVRLCGRVRKRHGCRRRSQPTITDNDTEIEDETEDLGDGPAAESVQDANIYELLHLSPKEDIRWTKDGAVFSPIEGEDRMWKVRPIYDAIAKRSKELILEERLCIDEQMVPFKGVGNMDTATRWSKKNESYEDMPRPEIVKKYNSSVGGVGKVDFLVSIYRIYIRRRKWTLRMIFHDIDIAVVNSWLEYKKDCGKCNIPKKDILDLMQFRLQLGEALAKSNVESPGRKRGRPRKEDNNGPKPEYVNRYECAPNRDVRHDGVDHLPIHSNKKGTGICKNKDCKGKSHFSYEKYEVFRSNAVKLSAYVKALANYMFTQRELEEKRESDKGYTAMHIKYTITTTNKAPNWHAMFSSRCPYLVVVYCNECGIVEVVVFCHEYGVVASVVYCLDCSVVALVMCCHGCGVAVVVCFNDIGIVDVVVFCHDYGVVASMWRQFLADNEALLKESQRAVQQAVETVQVNVLWHRRHYQHFTSSVQQHAAT
ncbi:hypothetical protein PR048_009013 [Dryococelus australis]|uniref:PiggyBac transposable element-derived protein domain-containing protein n=1 Tax=Dryococelus australis TaxID=614101 RepID=A0ABQ9HYR0_9NEOP|nr:hypothetical protein PR048_009013 [Dryococelus australis]